MANGDLQMNVDQMRKNPNVHVFWPAGPDGTRSTFALPYFVGLVKGAPHSDAGKKLIDFLLSKSAQESLPATAFGIPVRGDVKPSDEHFAEVHKLMQGVTVWAPDWAQAVKDLEADVAKWHEVTGS